MTPDKCPGCGTKLEPDMLACPNCPMSFPEDEPAPGVHPLKETRWYGWLLPAGFFAAIGALVWFLGSGLFRLGEENAVVEKSPALFGGAPPQAKIASSQISVPWESTAAAKAAPETEEAPPAETGGTLIVSSVPEERPKPKKPVREWRLRGTVYDLATLQPVGGAAIVFEDQEENRRIETRSDSSGRYKAIVNPLSGRGYQVTVSKSGYAPSYLDPSTEGVRRMPAAERKEKARELASMLSATPYQVQPETEKPLITDFYLAPRR